MSALKLLSAIVLAHSWYPQECCSDRDCRSVPCESIREDGGGIVSYQSPEGTEYRFIRVKPSLDNQCHVCIGQAGGAYCAFIQLGT
jgi:hypothetical protein